MLTALFFIVWIIFFDVNNIIDRFSEIKKKHETEEAKEYYKEKIIEYKQRIKELKTDDRNLEKFAREQYLMKKDNEDVYVIELDE